MSSMLQLWDVHIALTREVILAAKNSTANLNAALQNLLKNQEDLGRQWACFFGKKKGKKYTLLLTEHIDQAVAIVLAALEGKDITVLVEAWYENGKQIARFLAHCTGISKKKLTGLFFDHLDCTLEEAKAILASQWEASLEQFHLCLQHAQKFVATLEKVICKKKK